MAEKAICDYHKLTPHEIRVLELMEERKSWTILEFRSKLLELGRSFNLVTKRRKETEDQYRDFLKQRSNLFGMC